MPGTAVGLRLVALEPLGQGAVAGAPLARRRAVVDRRADERMAELQPRAVDRHEVGRLRCVERVPGGRAATPRGRRASRSPGRRWRPRAASAASPRAAGARAPGRPLSTWRVIGSAAGSGSVPESCASVSADGTSSSARALPRACSDEPLAHRRRRGLDAGSAREQRRRRLAVQAAEHQRGMSGSVEAADVALAGAEQDHDAVRAQAPGHEPQRVGRGLVEPVASSTRAEHRPAARRAPRAATGTRRRRGSARAGRRRRGRARRAAPRPAGRQAVEVRERRPQRAGNSAAKGSSLSDSTPRAQRTCRSLACSRASSSSADLPIPGSPRTTSAALWPSRAASSRAPIRARSGSRP